MKVIEYQASDEHRDTPTDPVGYVTYEIMSFGDDVAVIFSGFGRYVPPTVNVAERVVEAICEAECFDAQHYTFFDLQTSRQSRLLGPNEFEFDELDLSFCRGRPRVMEWIERVCPSFVMDAFRDHLGPSPKQRFRHLAQPPS